MAERLLTPAIQHPFITLKSFKQFADQFAELEGESERVYVWERERERILFIYMNEGEKYWHVKTSQKPKCLNILYRWYMEELFNSYTLMIVCIATLWIFDLMCNIDLMCNMYDTDIMNELGETRHSRGYIIAPNICQGPTSL